MGFRRIISKARSGLPSFSANGPNAELGLSSYGGNLRLFALAARMVRELQRIRERLFETSPNLQAAVTPGNSLANPQVSYFALRERNLGHHQKESAMFTDQTHSAALEPSFGFGKRFLDKIRQIRIHPFILVSIGREPESDAFIFCRTQNEAAAFVDELATVPRFAESLLLRGIERALQQEIYDAGDLLYRWTQSDGGSPRQSISVRRSEVLSALPMIIRICIRCANSPDMRGRTYSGIARCVGGYSRNQGNDALRFSIIEATALALGRALGAQSDFERQYRPLRRVSASNRIQFT